MIYSYLQYRFIFSCSTIHSPRNEFTFASSQWVRFGQRHLSVPSAMEQPGTHPSSVQACSVHLFCCSGWTLQHHWARVHLRALSSCQNPQQPLCLHRHSLWYRYSASLSLFLSFTSLQGVAISSRIAVSTENLHIFQNTSIYFLVYMGIAKTSSLFQHICWTVLKLFICCIYSGDMLVSQLLILSSACTEKLLPWTLEGQLVKHLSILPYIF